jgi:hypothetical protein
MIEAAGRSGMMSVWLLLVIFYFFFLVYLDCKFNDLRKIPLKVEYIKCFCSFSLCLAVGLRRVDFVAVHLGG